MKNINRADKNLIKKINTISILREIRDSGPISRADIAKKVKLNPATVSSNVLDLLNRNLVRERGNGKSSGGRKPILLEMNSDNYIVGVNLGIKKITVALMNINAEILYKEDTHIVDTDFESIAHQIKESIYRIGDKYTGVFDKMCGIGMGIHGLVESENGVSIFAPHFNWQDIAVADYFEKEFNVPVIVENDTRAMALGEKWFGATKESSNFIFLNIGSGIGAGIFLNDELYGGNNFGAGEVGHISMTDEKIKCNCGKYGCFESIASKEGITLRYKKLLETHKVKFEENDVSFDYIYSSARKGENYAVEVLRETGKYIGKSISMLVNILNPDTIILAGSVLKAKLFILPEIERTVASKSMNHNLKNLYIGETELKEEAGIIGAATLVIKDLFTV